MSLPDPNRPVVMTLDFCAELFDAIEIIAAHGADQARKGRLPTTEFHAASVIARAKAMRGALADLRELRERQEADNARGL